MPGIRPVYNPEDNAINELADKERQERITAIDLNWNYYYGNHAKPLKVTPGQSDDNIIVNLTGGAVDKTTEFIGCPRLSVEGGVDNVIDAVGRTEVVKSDAQQALEALVDASELDVLLADTLTSGSVSGHNFWRIVAPLDENGEFRPDNGDLPYLMLIDARYMTVYWDMMNPRQTLYYQMQWTIGDDVYRQDIVPGWMIEDVQGVAVADDEWAILEYVKSKKTSKFEFQGAEIWHYPFSPIIQWKNRRRPHSYYGDTDMRDARLNDALNFVISNTARIIKFHAHPRTIGTGMSMQDVVDSAIDGFFTVENPEASVTNLEMQSDLQSSMAMIEMLRSNFFSQMRVVDIASMKDRIGQVSNFGMRLMFDDMMKMIGDKRNRYGDRGIGEAFRRMLYMIGHEVEGVNPEWDDPLPVDYAELVASVEKEKNMGITSDQTLADDLGRDYAKEQAQLAEESNTRIEERVNTITRLAQSGANSIA